MTKERPDVAPPKEPPNEIFLQVEEEDDGTDLGGTTWCVDQINETDIRYVLAPPPSDAAPRACVDCGASVPHGGVGGGTTYWRSIPCPNGRPGCLVGHGEQVCRACAHPEDAPGGPYCTHHDVGKDEDESEWYVQNMKNGVIEFTGTETQCDAVRDALNRVDRLKGDET